MSMKPEQAVSGFKKGLNCSQTVMSVYRPTAQLSGVSGFLGSSHKT